MVGDLVAIGRVFALVVVVVEAGVTKVPDLALQATGEQDVVEGLQRALEGEAVALLSAFHEQVQPLLWTTGASRNPLLLPPPQIFSGSCTRSFFSKRMYSSASKQHCFPPVNFWLRPDQTREGSSLIEESLTFGKVIASPWPFARAYHSSG